MQHSHLVPYVLPTQNYSAGNRSTQTLRDLPKVFLGRLAHLVKFVFSITQTPTFTVAPDVVGFNNIFTACDFWDGTFMRFQGGFNHMRMKERVQLGHNRLADPSTATASASSRYGKRVLHVGPPQLQGFPSDFVVPTGMLENGELRFTHGALSDLQGNTGTVSAATGNVRVTAFLVLLDEIRIPPAYQYVNQAANAQDVNLAGRALYESIALCPSASFGAWSSGQVGNLRLDLGNGDIIPTVSARDLGASFADDFAAGEIGVPQGDPEGTADTNNVTVNRGAPTGLTTPANDLQPVLWMPPDARISKLPIAESVCRLRWDGSSTSALILVGRILPQPATVIAAGIAKAIGRLNLKNKGASIKSLSKKAYGGPYAEFMPIKVKV